MSGVRRMREILRAGEVPVSQEAEQVLVHAPFGRDGMICGFLGQSGISARICQTVEDVCAQLDENTGAVLISDA